MSNQARLNQFIQAALADGRPAHLIASAEKVRGFMVALSDAAAKDIAPPAHLVGLSAFDLADAADQLEAAASARRAA